nr:MarR family transcriptional regulator [Eubacterium sp.]
EISWKQFFAIICINMCKEPPTLKELSDILGSSHQNVKQILLKLEKKNFIEFKVDESDKRKQRIIFYEVILGLFPYRQYRNRPIFY